MAAKSDAEFDNMLANAFADYGTSVRGYIRYQLVKRNLEPFLKNKKLDVLDIGGGGGSDAAWLAEKGHTVHFIEPSADQRRFAERRFNFLLSDKARSRVIMGGNTLADVPKNTQYDLVLVHAVAMYQADTEAFLLHSLKFVKPGGLISIMEKNYYGAQFRGVMNSDYSDLNRLQRNGRSVNTLKKNVYTFKPGDLQTVLETHGFTVEDWSGIQMATHTFNMPVDKLDKRKLNTIMEIEYEHGHNSSVRGHGQMIQFIARKNI